MSAGKVVQLVRDFLEARAGAAAAAATSRQPSCDRTYTH